MNSMERQSSELEGRPARRRFGLCRILWEQIRKDAKADWLNILCEDPMLGMDAWSYFYDLREIWDRA